ncbi:MAG TPA: YegS/Rv2252/BmrU family lipid kinase [Segetibacter sp.]
MTETTITTILFVVNPISGGKDKKDYKNAIEKYFAPLPHKIDLFLLDDKNNAQYLENRIEKLKPQIVVAVGGDGTVSMVAKKIIGKDIVLGILPAGSANGMARELNIPENIEGALAIIENGRVKEMDALSINNQLCLHLSDIGLNARLVKYFEGGNMRGKLGYAKVALRLLFNTQNISVNIVTKDSEITRDAFMVVLANASKYGTGAVINPTGDLYDGLFEVVIMRQLSIITILKMWLRPKTLNPKKLEVIQARAVNIVTQRKVHFQVDGEYIGKVHRVIAKILPAHLKILLPEES